MSNVHFPASLKPIVSKGYSYQRGGNVYRSEVTGGLPRQGRDTYFDTVPFTVTLVTSALGNQTFQLFLNKISGGADSFVMALDSGLGVKDHQCQINSDINIDTSDGINWTIAFSLLAERTDIQEDTCLTANLPDLFGCYGDGLNCFLAAYATAQTTFPRVWEPNVIAQFNAVAREFVGIGFSRASEGTYIDELGGLQTATVNTPRYEVDGLLVEPSSTNLNVRGWVDPATWVSSALSLSALMIGADGISYVKAVPTSVITNHFCRPPTHNVVVGAVTFSALVQSGEYKNCQISCEGSSEWENGVRPNARFDLEAGVVLSAQPNTLARMREVGGGWWLCSISVNCVSNSTTRVSLWVSSPNGTGVTWGGDGVSGLLMAFAQAEQLNYATTFIPTDGVPSTRAADVLTLQVTGAKRVYREYTPLGSSTPVTETVPYTGELCPPGHVRVIKVLND